MSYFNEVFKKELNKNKLEINENFKGAFGFEQKNAKKGIEEFWKKLYAIIYKPIKKSDVETSAKDENIKITHNTAGLFDFEHIKTSTRTYNLAILQIYSHENSSKSIDDLISGFKSGKIPKDKQEGISLLIGINNGYKSFRAEQKFVKFKMDSLLDYYTIESIFQHAINNKQNCSSFEYIEKIAPKKQEDESFNLGKKIISHYILDEAVYGNKTFFDECLQEFKNNEDDTGLKPNLKNILQKFVNIINENFNKYLQLESENKTLKDEIEKLKQEIDELKEKNKNIDKEEIKLIEHKTDTKPQENEQANDETLNFKENKKLDEDKKAKKIENNTDEKKDNEIDQDEILKNANEKPKNANENLSNNTKDKKDKINPSKLKPNTKPQENEQANNKLNTETVKSSKNNKNEKFDNEKNLDNKQNSVSNNKQGILIPDKYTEEELSNYTLQQIKDICKKLGVLINEPEEDIAFLITKIISKQNKNK